MKSKILKINEIKKGDQASFNVKVSKKLVDSFAKLTKDYNPLHTNPGYAKQTKFGRRVAHGMLVSSFFSTLIGMYLPGRDSLIVKQEIKYLKPVFIGDDLKIIGVVNNINKNTRLIEIDIRAVKVKQNEIAIKSKAMVLIR